MIKNRHFMLGLGVGLILGALLLQVMLIGQGQPKNLSTMEQVQQAAEQLNLKVVTNTEELLTEDEWKAKSQEAALSDLENDSAPTTLEPNTPTTPESPQTPNSPESKDETDSNVPKTDEQKIDAPDSPDSPNEPEPVVVEYKIRSGATLSNVAAGLKKAGVISDENAFIKKASAKGINRKLQVGTYHFTIGEDFSSIISKITLKSAGK